MEDKGGRRLLRRIEGICFFSVNAMAYQFVCSRSVGSGKGVMWHNWA